MHLPESRSWSKPPLWFLPQWGDILSSRSHLSGSSCRSFRTTSAISFEPSMLLDACPVGRLCGPLGRGAAMARHSPTPLDLIAPGGEALGVSRFFAHCDSH